MLCTSCTKVGWAGDPSHIYCRVPAATSVKHQSSSRAQHWVQAQERVLLTTPADGPLLAGGAPPPEEPPPEEEEPLLLLLLPEPDEPLE